MKFPAAWRAGIEAACDPEIFARALSAWAEGLDTPMLPSAVQPADQAYYITDTAFHRTGFAVHRLLKEAGVLNPQGYLWRVLHFHEILQKAGSHGLSAHVREDEVSLALIHAGAVARIQFDEGQVFDMEDVARCTAEFERADEAAAGDSQQA